MKKLMTVIFAMLFAASTGAVFAQAKADAKKDDAKKSEMKKDDVKKDDKKGDKGAKK